MDDNEKQLEKMEKKINVILNQNVSKLNEISSSIGK
jgi:flagellar hook-associated protein FlgK